MENVKGRDIANGRLEFGQFEGLANTAIMMCLVGMTEENLSSPCLAYNGPLISSRIPLAEAANPQSRNFAAGRKKSS